MEKTKFELTNPQKAVWLTNQVYPNTAIENICGCIFIEQKVNFSALENAINLFIEKNDSFRIKLTKVGKEIKQYVSDFEAFKVEKIKVTSKEEIKKLQKEMVLKVFPLLESLFVDFCMFEFPNGDGGFIINAHHIIADAWTAGLMVNEITEFYAEFIGAKEKEETEFPSYIDYISSEKEYLSSDRFKKDKEYWEELFSRAYETAKIPSVREKVINNIDCTAKRIEFNVSKEIISKINEFCARKKLSIYNFFVAMYSLYIGKITNLQEFVIGTPILNRTTFKEKHTTGMFVSTVPLKISYKNGDNFESFVEQIAKDSLSMLRHQKYPYQYLLEKLREKDKSVPNLYDVLISYQNVKSNTKSSQIPFHADWIPNDCVADGINIHLYDMNDTGTLNVAYDYQILRYEEEDIKNMHTRIIEMVKQVLQNTEIELQNIDIVTNEEKLEIINVFNETDVKYDETKTLSVLFEEQVEKTPNETALVFGEKTLTYKELNERSNSLAYILRNNGIGRNDIIGIMVNRSLEMIISILAVLKAGAAYIPIDPEYPQDRVEYMLENSNAKMLLTFENLKNKVKYSNKIFVELKNEIYNSNKTNLQNINKPEDLAYLIYTSGSTGKPKGVMLKHKSLSNLANYCNNYVEYLKNPKYRAIVSVTTVSFDIFIFETLISLQKGLKLVIANEEEQTIPRLLNNLIEKNNVEIIQTTPSRMQLLVNNIKDIPNISNLKFITLAGEQLPIALVNELKKISSPTIYNGYGPSETTVFSSLTDITNHDFITIGKPLNNTRVYILNSSLNICPIGIPGEIYITGDGVGKGYINNTELTKKSYLTNIGKAIGCEKDVFYKTGDLGYYLPNGEIVCLGRCDNQVKIRGLRIELEEIENEILNYENIDATVVVKKTIESAKRENHEFLCAYYISSKEINLDMLRNKLLAKLPKYMVPQYFIRLEEFPYTPNGKIDRKKLPMPCIETKNKNIVLPRNKEDETLLEILKEILNVENISIEDSFFELGGDSLAAINLCTKVYSEFNVQIFVKEILENAVIKELSDLIQAKITRTDLNKITKAKNSEFYPVSSAQKRTYYASNVSGENSTLYNICGGLILSKKLDFSKLKNAFNKLIERQPALRTYFEVEGEEVVQKIQDKIDFNLEVEENYDGDIKQKFDEFLKPFDLSKAPLLQAKVLNLADEKAILMINMHHIISDGMSLSILVNELCKLYNGESLEELKIDYKDYSVWEENNLKSGEFSDAETYWKSQFEGEIPLLNMPTKTRPAVQSFEGNKVYGVIEKEYVDKINQLAKATGTTPYMIMLACYYILLSKYTSQSDIVVGTPIVNRSMSELYNVVGMFVNSLPLRMKIDKTTAFKDFLNEVKSICLESYKYQSYPFDELVKSLNLTRDTSRNPLFDTMFTYQNNGYKKVNFGEIEAKYYIPKTDISKFDLSLEIVPDEDVLNLSFEYATKLFDDVFIRNLQNHYINIVKEILSNEYIKIEDISIISIEEKNKILYEFNNTKLEYAKEKTIAKLFEEQVRRTPQNIAVVFGKQQLTYKELNEKANSLACFLRSEGVEKNDIIGIMLNRSIDIFISILAVLKAGGAYLPIDPTYPKSRITYMIEDSNVKKVLTENCIKERFYDLDKSILINVNSSKIYSYPTDNLKDIKTPDDLAYLIYTSGSTGKPKGVMVTEKNVNNFIQGTTKVIEFKDTIVSVTTMCFDIFALESLLPLTNGLKIVVANEEEQNIPKLLNELCIKNDVKMLQTTPARMSLLLSDPTSLDYIKNLSVIMLGGEPFPYKLLQELKELTNAKIYNMYGPTETTVWSSIKDLSTINSITIGTPIANTKMYILDKSLNVLPIGVPGDLYIAGDGVSRGYLGREKLTQEKFVENKYEENEIMYNTGDMAKWLPNGEIDCLGRSDSQVKLRGLRIELGEIEKQIVSFHGIDNSAVCIKKDQSDREFLCGYFVSKLRISISELKNYLSKFLPNYMIPSFLIQLESFKYTPNGKVDKNSLPSPNIKEKEVIIAPETETEIKLLKIWEELLGVSPISIDENFFNIGGDSILALKMQIELLNNEINVSYADIFKYNTIKELALRIDLMSTSSQTEEYYKDYDFKQINSLLKNNNLENALQIEKKEIGDILLTGATGYLGAHILDYLLSNTNKKVYCMIRKDANNATSTEEKLMDKLNYYFDIKHNEELNKRLFVITSNVSDEKLGLDDSTLEELASKISCVINSAAIVKHYGYYSEFEKTNVIGVKNLIDFCEKYNKKLVQISTISVSGNTLTDLGIQENSFDKNVSFTESNLYINQGLNNVYVRSKFEAEKLILENILNNSLDALILRVGNITSRFSDGKFQPNSNENAFLNRLKAFMELKSIPDYMLNNYIEFSPVDNLAEAIVRSIENVSSKINVLHLYNNNHVYIKDLLKVLPDNLINVVTDEEFKNILNRNLQISNNKDIISHIANDLDKDKKLVYVSNIKIKNKISAEFLEKIGFEWGKIDKRYITNLLNIV